MIDHKAFLKKSISDLDLKRISSITHDEELLSGDESYDGCLIASRNASKEVLPVMYHNRVLGLVSKMSLITAVHGKQDAQLSKLTASDIMMKDVSSCSTYDTLKVLFSSIFKSPSDSLVLNNAKGFLGIIDYFDLARIFEDTSFIIDNPPIIKNFLDTSYPLIDATSTLKELLQVFMSKKCNYCLVERNGVVCGIVTIKDVIGSMYNHLELRDVQVQSVMSPTIMSLNSWMTLHDAFRIMLERRFNQIPIMDDRVVVGVLSIKKAVIAYHDYIKSINTGDFQIDEL